MADLKETNKAMLAAFEVYRRERSAAEAVHNLWIDLIRMRASKRVLALVERRWKEAKAKEDAAWADFKAAEAIFDQAVRAGLPPLRQDDQK